MSSSDADQKIDEFVAITGGSKDLAKSLLAICNGNLEMAINMHMEGVQTEETTQPGTSNSTSTTASASNSIPDDEDDVRAPIPQREEVLIQPGYEGYSINRTNKFRQSRVRTVFDGFRNFSNETKSNGASSAKGKKRTLEELFKPPIDIMFKGDFQSARDAATASKKWLMINVQDACEFPCQVLNRDVWSNEAVKTILREHFIFWQQYKESEDAQRFMTFYPVNDWPYVAILDPRTGELLVTWKKLDASTFCDLVTEFLSLHPSLEPINEDSKKVENNDKNGTSSKVNSEQLEQPPNKKMKTVDSILDANEDDQIAAAIRASLAEESSKKKNVPKKKSNKEAADSDLSDEDESDDDEIVDVDEDTFDNVESFSADNSNSAAAFQIRSNNSSGLNDLKTDTTKDNSDNNDWEKYLGNKDDPTSSIMIRFPNGNRITKEIPCSSQFLAIVKFVVSEGFPLDSHEIVTNYPRRILTDMDTSQTLKEMGLFPKEMVIVQQK